MTRRLASLAMALGLLASAGATVLADSTAAPAERPAVLDHRLGIDSGFRRPDVMDDIGPGWERDIFSWAQIQPNGPSDFFPQSDLSPGAIQRELNRPTKIAAVLEFTPTWARSNSADGQRSVPRNLDLPFDDPNNYWGQFAYRIAQAYKGRIDEWVIWNEPEWLRGDGEGTYTWAGTDAQFARLTKVAYLAIKKANPNAIVSFAGTSYWVEINAGRVPMYDRVLALILQDPDAPANNYFHDVMALNIYQSPDDIYRIFGVYRAIMKKYGIDKPIWLTETNAPPKDDRQIPCWEQQARGYPRTTMAQQAAFAPQAYAMAAAAGYQRVGFYQMTDQNPCEQPQVSGVIRDDGTAHPVRQTLKTAVQYFSNYNTAQFMPLARQTQEWPAWPDDPTSYVPNWEVYLVGLDLPNNRRVSALWNGDGKVLRARIKQTGSSAVMVDVNGNVKPLTPNQGWWVVDLMAATAYGEVDVGGSHFSDPPNYHYIGGEPVLIVEEGVDPSAPVTTPALGDPGSAQGDFTVSNLDGDQSVGLGSPVTYRLRTTSQDGFGWPITYSVQQWSTQRFPDPKDGSTLPFGSTLPQGVTPGSIAPASFDTMGADPGIYFITILATATDPADPTQTVTHTVDLALVLNPGVGDSGSGNPNAGNPGNQGNSGTVDPAGSPA